jgi:hypothetical protein
MNLLVERPVSTIAPLNTKVSARHNDKRRCIRQKREKTPKRKPICELLISDL